MLIKNHRKHDPLPSEITPESVYLQRRRLIQGAAALAAVGAAPGLLLPSIASAEGGLGPLKKSAYSTFEQKTSFKDLTRYNNFYEFGTDKSDPAKYAHTLKTRPWTIAVEGECEKPGTIDYEDFIRPHALEERIYRLRCVEAWSMVVPWAGIPMGDVLKRFQPTSKAKYVAFETLYDPEQMPGQKRRVLDWPYVEGLRIDEAMHPLTFFAVGVYGKDMPKQNGAPIRLVVPWKYGFKSIKSIVRIRFTELQPQTAWNRSAPNEYGFYSNVNPDVNHPRWSQKKERRIGSNSGGILSALFTPKQETLMFNGYADQVAQLYQGMDLKKYF